MSGIEVIGLALAIIPLFNLAFDNLTDRRVNVYRRFFRRFTRSAARRKNEYGTLNVWLMILLFPDALRVMDRIEKNVLGACGGDKQIVSFLQSYTTSFNMIGVAGAIIAQVAITAMSLTNLAGSHWTAEAFFVASLVTGALSVFFSCAISPAFHGLYGATDIRNFLTRPTKDLNKLNQILASLKAIASPEAQDKDAHIVDDLRRLQSQWRVPSPAAAVMITVPMSLLNISLNAFLIGLGIYLGKVFTAKLIPSYGLGSLIILIVFVVTTLTGISMFYVAQGFKAMEKVSAVELQKLVEATEDELRRLNGHFDESGRSPSRVPEQTEATANLNSSSTSVPIQPRTLTFNRDRSQRLLTELVELQRHILRTTELLVEAVSESPE